ncbi:MAG: EAL domain-containing protein [Acidobacteriota bacterium]|nr:EAL domain-containing protein [Acidobacteriota bacterium]
MPKLLHALIVEDSEADTELLRHELMRAGYDPVCERVETADAMGAALDRQDWDIVISDYSMPRFNGLEALRLVQQRKLDIPFIIVSGTIGEDRAVAAMKAGAHDYILKDNLKRLVPAITRELKEAQVRLERRQEGERVQFLAYYDLLTHLPNRLRFLEQLEQIIADTRKTGQTAALLLLDLNHFREINETLGHDNGDALLRQAAEHLLPLLRRSDMAARLGGDDFALLLYPGDAQYADGIARRALETLTAPFEVAGFSLEVGAKIGIALFPEHGASAKQLLQHAGVALSLAKQGANACCVYDARHDPSDPRRLQLMSDLRTAIGSSQIAPHFQPKVCMRSGHLIGVEALVRWQHPERGAVPPDEFIPLAEKTGMIGPLTLYMLEKSLQACHEWHMQGLKIPVAVNLSVKDLLDETLVDKVEALLAGRDMKADMLELEITETAIMGDPMRALEVLTGLSDLGIHLYIDDFGTGYSSLGYLKKLPVDAVKIDRSFVNDMTRNDDSATIVRSTIDLAHNLNLKVTAEGVENQATWDRLAQYGCDEAQGYHIGRPMPGETIPGWVGGNSWKPR